jgi:hypothetical protein
MRRTRGEGGRLDFVDDQHRADRWP